MDGGNIALITAMVRHMTDLKFAKYVGGHCLISPEQGFYKENQIIWFLGAVSISRLGVWLQMEATDREKMKMIEILNPNS